ncbi:MAG: energy transducer TonB [Balneolaceae bacterium]|nr:energy transducer TonB [Balneolaceae bacterium]
MALANRNTSAAPMVHFEAIRQYIKLARKHEIIDMKSIITDSLAADSTVTDSTAIEMEFRGAYWDSVRTILNEHQEQFSGNPIRKKVDKLSEELGPIKENQPQQQQSNSIGTCRERGIKPEISQGMDSFLETVNYPEQLKGTNLAGSVEYEIRISSSGQVQGYELVSQKTNLGIEDAFEEAIQNHLAFAPLDLDESTPVLRCRISFPISK